MKKIICLVLACVLLNACSSRLMGASIISTKPVDLPPHANLYEYPCQKVSGTDSVFMVVVPWRIPRIKHAVNDALEKGNGDLMIHSTIYTHYWWFIVGRYTIEVKGTVVNLDDVKKTTPAKKVRGKKK